MLLAPLHVRGSFLAANRGLLRPCFLGIVFAWTPHCGGAGMERKGGTERS